MKFKLTLTFPNNKIVTAEKEILTNPKDLWKKARKWKANCEAICGKNELGQEFIRSELEKLDNQSNNS